MNLEEQNFSFLVSMTPFFIDDPGQCTREGRRMQTRKTRLTRLRPWWLWCFSVCDDVALNGCFLRLYRTTQINFWLGGPAVTVLRKLTNLNLVGFLVRFEWSFPFFNDKESTKGRRCTRWIQRAQIQMIFQPHILKDCSKPIKYATFNLFFVEFFLKKLQLHQIDP